MMLFKPNDLYILETPTSNYLNMQDILFAIGYPATAVLTFLIMGYFGKQLFVKLLDTVVEDHKAELNRETERLKAQLIVESEVYKLAAQKRFECLLALWQSSEALFEETNFASKKSIESGLKNLDEAIKGVNQNAVLMSNEIIEDIQSYLQGVGKVLTISEKEFDPNAVTNTRIEKVLKGFASKIRALSPEISLLAAIGASIIPSAGKALEDQRRQSALEARGNLENALKKEFGVWISKDKVMMPPA